MELYKILCLVAIICFNLCECRYNKAKRGRCPPPNAEELVKLHERYAQVLSSDIDDSFGRLTAIRKENKSVYNRRLQNRLNFNLENPKYLNSNELCPSYNVMEYDSYRIPQAMIQAKCSTRKCQCKRLGYHIKPLYYYKRVLRVVGCDDGKRNYETVWEKVSVGCQCYKNNDGVMPI